MALIILVPVTLHDVEIETSFVETGESNHSLGHLYCLIQAEEVAVLVRDTLINTKVHRDFIVHRQVIGKLVPVAERADFYLPTTFNRVHEEEAGDNQREEFRHHFT